MRNVFSKAVVAFSIFIAGISAQAQQTVAAVDNSITMGYMSANITQTVVLSSAQQAAGTFTFSTQAANGGGRYGQSDTFSISMTFYDANNTALGTATSGTVLLPLTNVPVGGSSNSGYTPIFQTVTATSASYATATTVKITFTGIDGSYWAGNYGPIVMAPTFTYTPTGGSAGNNLIYNPEFGIYTGGGSTAYAQGWTSSLGWQNCAAYSGTATCVTNNGGTVNAANGGYIANGGTSSAPAGGVASSTPSTPTVTGTTTTNTTSATTVAGATTSATAVVNGAPIVTAVVTYGKQQTSTTVNIDKNTVTTTDIPVTTTVTRTTPYVTTTTVTPTTVTTYSDGTSTSTTGQATVTTSTVNQVAVTTTHSDVITSATTDQYYSTRIDQYSQMQQTSTTINYALASDSLSRTNIVDGKINFRNGTDRDMYVNDMVMKAGIGFDTSAHIQGIGYEQKISDTTVLGWQYNHAETLMNSNATAGGNFNKDMVSVYGLTVVDDWLFKFDYAGAVNHYYGYHTLSALNATNASDYKGSEEWISARIYTPSIFGFRPFIGERATYSYMNAINETGTALTAASFASTKNVSYVYETGLALTANISQNWAINEEISRDTNDFIRASAGLSYKTTTNSSILIKAMGQAQKINDQWQHVNFAQAEFRLNF